MEKTIKMMVLAWLVSMNTACEVVGGIFKAGMIWGIFLVVLVIVGIFYLISKTRK